MMQNPEMMQNLFSSFGQLFGQSAQPSSQQPSSQPSAQQPSGEQPSAQQPSSQQQGGGLGDLLNNPEFRQTWVPRFSVTSSAASLMQNPEIQNLANSFRSFMGGNAPSETPQHASEDAQQGSAQQGSAQQDSAQREGGSENRPESRSEAQQGGWEGLLNNPLLQQA